MALTSGDIIIHAEPDEVMAVIADLEAYPEWATGIGEVDIMEVDADSRPHTVRMTLNSPPIRDSYVLVYEWSDDHVTWSMAEEGSMLKKLDGVYEVESVSEGSKVTYRLEVDVKIPLLGKLKRKAEKVIIDAALKGLKQRIESE